MSVKGEDLLLSSFREQSEVRACTITRQRPLPAEPIESIGQNFVVTARSGETVTHKFDTVHFLMFLELKILDYVPLVHPLGD